MSQKIARSVSRNDLGMSLIEECECPSGGTGINCLPQPIEYKYRLIEQIIHDPVVDAQLALHALSTL